MDKGYRRPTKRSRDLRENMTPAERKLWEHLRARKVAGVRFNTQFPIGEFVGDFVSRSAKLVIEVDGATHGESERADAARTRYIEKRGYRVIRFWNNEVIGNVEGVVSEIERVLREMAIARDTPSQHQVKQPPAVSARPGDERPDAPSRKREGNADGAGSPKKLPSRLREGLGEGLPAARHNVEARKSPPAARQQKRDQ